MLLPYTAWQCFCSYPSTVTPLLSVVSHALHTAKNEVLTCVYIVPGCYVAICIWYLNVVRCILGECRTLWGEHEQAMQ